MIYQYYFLVYYSSFLFLNQKYYINIPNVIPDPNVPMYIIICHKEKNLLPPPEENIESPVLIHNALNSFKSLALAKSFSN